MSSARSEFLHRLSLLRACLAEPAANDGLPNEIVRNDKASVIRNGLAVLTYATAEAFIRDRTAEILKSFDPLVVTFPTLPDKLKSAVTIGALKGLLYRSRYEDPVDRVTWTLSKLPAIASASQNVSALSELSFANEHPNVSAEEVKAILAAFGVHSGWICITNLSKRIGLGGVPDYCAAFENIAKRRHAAAHDVTTHTPHGDLSSSIDTLLGFGISFDVLLSEACSRFNVGIALPDKNVGSLDGEIGMRFVTPHPTIPGSFREMSETTLIPQKLHSVKVYPSLAAARASVAAKMKVKRQHLVEWDATSIPATWSTW